MSFPNSISKQNTPNIKTSWPLLVSGFGFGAAGIFTTFWTAKTFTIKDPGKSFPLFALLATYVSASTISFWQWNKLQPKQFNPSEESQNTSYFSKNPNFFYEIFAKVLRSHTPNASETMYNSNQPEPTSLEILRAIQMLYSSSPQSENMHFNDEKLNELWNKIKVEISQHQTAQLEPKNIAPPPNSFLIKLPPQSENMHFNDKKLNELQDNLKTEATQHQALQLELKKIASQLNSLSLELFPQSTEQPASAEEALKHLKTCIQQLQQQYKEDSLKQLQASLDNILIALRPLLSLCRTAVPSPTIKKKVLKKAPCEEVKLPWKSLDQAISESISSVKIISQLLAIYDKNK